MLSPRHATVAGAHPTPLSTILTQARARFFPPPSPRRAELKPRPAPGEPGGWDIPPPSLSGLGGSCPSFSGHASWHFPPAAQKGRGDRAPSGQASRASGSQRQLLAPLPPLLLPTPPHPSTPPTDLAPPARAARGVGRKPRLLFPHAAPQLGERLLGDLSTRGLGDAAAATSPPPTPARSAVSPHLLRPPPSFSLLEIHRSKTAVSRLTVACCPRGGDIVETLAFKLPQYFS